MDLCVFVFLKFCVIFCAGVCVCVCVCVCVVGSVLVLRGHDMWILRREFLCYI
jgi:hypothetical protein